MTGGGQITQLLNEWAGGDARAGDALAPLVYEELHKLSSRLFRAERGGHTLQPTALVHEVYEKLVDVDVSWQDRAHFFALAARMMRRMLVNHAKHHNAEKRGGGENPVTLHEGKVSDSSVDAELLDLDEALTSLAEIDPRKAELVQLQYFGGLSFREMEQVTGLSSSTLDRDLRLARAWLKDCLSK
ncbi:MAG: sigma-70 family RNA polymerase sigma factor [Gammaproteobacteria bacterium]|nr:sigma-70 family RNA polymerase sigma factor [Gammaproteobacteria bacterium]